jgi:hypothetical protein
MNATVRQGQRITGFGPDSPYYTAEHDAFRLALRRWVAAEIAPCVAAWDEAEQFPRELYRKAAEIGLLQIGYPEAYGGIPADLFYTLIAFQELARAGSGGVVAGLLSHTIGAPPIQNGGNAALKSAVLPAILAGRYCSIEDRGASARRFLYRQWFENLYYLGDASGLADYSSAYWRTRPRWRVDIADRCACAGRFPHAAAQDRLVGIRYSDPVFRQCPGSRQPLAGRGKPRIPISHAQFQ